MKLFHPSDIELRALQTAEVVEIIKTIKISAAVSEILQNFEQEDQEYDSDTIVVDTSHVGIRNAREKVKEKETTHLESLGISDSFDIGILIPISVASTLLSRMLSPFQLLTRHANPIAISPIQGVSRTSEHSNQVQSPQREEPQPAPI